MSEKEIRIGIIGLGYVGLPLAIEFSKHFSTIGYDISNDRITQLKNGFDKTREVNKKVLNDSKLILSNDSGAISQCNIYIVTVPTPINEEKTPDLYPLESASKLISKSIKKNDIVIYESTVYPGATEGYCVPIIEKMSGLKYNKDFFCGYSPERINPGDKKHTIKKIKKVTSGSNKKTSDIVDMLYSTIITAGTFKASSIAVAEAAKVIENTQRDVNIALMNELSMIFNRLNLDTNEILEASGTKWNFLPFKPGLVGGHCIGVDPYYLTYKALEVGYSPDMILAGRKINDNMGDFILENLINHLSKKGLSLDNSKIAVFGITFKENCPDLRNSKVLNIIEKLKKTDCEIFIIDSWVNAEEAKLYDIELCSSDLLNNLDAVILAVSHNEYKLIPIKFWERVMSKKGIILDVKSIYGKDLFKNSNIYHWRL